MAFVLKLAVGDDQCVLTNANCARRERKHGKPYELRTYSSSTPFKLLLFNVINEEARCEFVKSLEGKYKGVKGNGRSVQSNRSDGSKAS